jgi:AcrR family transcriptional regulator
VVETIEQRRSGRTKYASQAMMERRRRMLTVALQMIEEGGVAAFNVRTLCERAEVSPRTLYYTFGNKEDLLIAAIEHHFHGFTNELPPPPAFSDLEAVLFGLDAIADIVVRERRYAAAMVEVFFSPSGAGRVRDDLLRLAVGRVAQTKDMGLVSRTPAAELEAVRSLMINAGYANVGDFVFGRISEKAFRLRAKINVLTIGFQLFRPKVRAAAKRILERLSGELD